MAKQKYYVVWAGRKTGIFTSWDACESQVNGFKGARFKSFPSKAEAEAAFKADPETQTTKRSRPLRSEEHTSELQSRGHLVCRLLLEKIKEKDMYHLSKADRTIIQII